MTPSVIDQMRASCNKVVCAACQVRSQPLSPRQYTRPLPDPGSCLTPRRSARWCLAPARKLVTLWQAGTDWTEVQTDALFFFFSPLQTTPISQHTRRPFLCLIYSLFSGVHDWITAEFVQTFTTCTVCVEQRDCQNRREMPLPPTVLGSRFLSAGLQHQCEGTSLCMKM